MLNLNSILIFSDNPKKLSDFYQKILGQKPGWTGGDFIGFQIGSGYLTIGPHDNVHGKNKNPERMMMNFETTDVMGEFKRIESLGTKVVADPYHPQEASDMWIATFEDPDGNYFQLQPIVNNQSQPLASSNN